MVNRLLRHLEVTLIKIQNELSKLSIEFGSDFHYYSSGIGQEDFFWQSSKFTLFFSGRVALYNLLKFGISKYGWKKVGFPSYYCHEVVRFCETLPIEVTYYTYNPFLNSRKVEWSDEEGDVFVNVDFFGFRKIDTKFFKNSIIIDDLTHNLLSIKESEADYCFGSLRKQLPIATGGFCMSRRNDFTIDIPESTLACELAMDKLTAMWLKRKYLNGILEDKNLYREIAMNAEEQFGAHQTNSCLPNIIKEQLKRLATESIIAKTHSNVAKAMSGFDNMLNRGLHLLGEQDATGMGLVFIADNPECRNSFRSYLIEKNVYPAILWPNQHSDVDTALEDRILFVHVDFRYTENDLDFIIGSINKFIKNA